MTEPRPWVEPFLAELRQGRTVRVACDMAGVSPKTAYMLRRRSLVFRRAWNEALVEGILGRPLPLAS